MTPKVQQLLSETLQLPPEELMDFAGHFWDKLYPFDAEFEAEIQRRSREADEHPETLIPAEQVFAEIDAELEAIRAKRKAL